MSCEVRRDSRHHISPPNFYLSRYRNQTKISKSDLEVYAMFLPMAMFFYILFYVSMPFNEERTEFKKLQPISPFVYWTSVFMFDALIHAIYSYFMYTIHYWADTHHVFDEKEYSKCERDCE